MRRSHQFMQRFQTSGVIVLIAVFILAASAFALRDETNQKRWDKPCQKGPDPVVPGFLVNMGPTGARGILTKKSFIVKFIFPDTPAAKVLKLDDEVYGANGKEFAEHTFGGRVHGIEGPLQDMGMAIEDSEGSDDGLLHLKVKRGESNLTVDVQLEKLGRFGDTLSTDCKKLQILRARAYKYLMDHPGEVGPQGRCVQTLAFLSSHDAKIFEAGKQLALAWNKPYDDKAWSWPLAFQGIALAEYYLLTKDSAVLLTLQSTSDLLRNCQWKGPNVICYKYDPEKDKAFDQETQQKHMDLYDGGFGHAPYSTVIVPCGGGGYGPMQTPTVLAVTAWRLAKLCGIHENHPGVEKAFVFVEHGINTAGHVAYGGEFTLNRGIIDPEKWKANTNTGTSNRSGYAYIAYMLSPDQPDAGAYMKLLLSNIDVAYKDMPDGHADAMMGLTWGLAGTLASDDAALKKKVSQYYIPWLNMARCAGSDSYVILPGRDYADLAYYRENIRNYTTASVAFIYSFATPRLRVQGVDRQPPDPETPKIPESPETSETPKN